MQNTQFKTMADIFPATKVKQSLTSRITDIPLSLIDPFPNHPFHVIQDEDMESLMESIKDHGVITPAIVRRKDDRYEMISGHRRKFASELLQKDTLRCEVVDLSDDDATILMADSNLHRSKIRASEKAFSYKMKLEAMRRKAGRPNKKNGVPLEHHSVTGKSREILAAESGNSNSQIQRFIRLTYLIPDLLKLVDEERMKMRPAIELSYLKNDLQEGVLDEILRNDATPSHDQAIRMRKLSVKGLLTFGKIREIMEENKPNQKERFSIVVYSDTVNKYFPKNLSAPKREEFISKAIEFYCEHLSSK